MNVRVLTLLAEQDPKERNSLFKWFRSATLNGEITSSNTMLYKVEFQALLEMTMPSDRMLSLGMSYPGERASYLDHLRAVLGGPSNQIDILDGHLVAISACRQHSCDEKGLFWADLENNRTAALIVHFHLEDIRSRGPMYFFASKDFSSLNQLPEDFWTSFVAWREQELDDVDMPASINFLDGNGNIGAADGLPDAAK